MSTEIVVVVRHELVQLGIEGAIAHTRDLRVAGSARNVKRATRLMTRLRPDLCIVSVDLHEGGGMSLLATAQASGMHTRIIMLGPPCRERDVFQAMRDGAAGFIDSHDPADRVCDFLRRAARGFQVLSDAAQGALFRHLRDDRPSASITHPPAAEPEPTLSVREMQVLRCAAEGLSIIDTAMRLNMSAATVKNHRQHIFVRLGVPNIPAAVYRATRDGLLR